MSEKKHIFDNPRNVRLVVRLLADPGIRSWRARAASVSAIP